MTPALACLDLSVRFGSVHALDGASLSVAPGAALGIVGPNGAGKSTLLDAISGIARAERGSVRLHGVEVGRWSVARRARSGLGRTFQSPARFGALTVAEHLDVGAPPVLASVARLSREALESFGLHLMATRFARDLSATETRLLDACRALALGPRVLLLDEPAAGLDAAQSTRLAALLRRVRDAGAALVVVEHRRQLVHEVCDDVQLVEGGRLDSSTRETAAKTRAPGESP